MMKRNKVLHYRHCMLYACNPWITRTSRVMTLWGFGFLLCLIPYQSHAREMTEYPVAKLQYLDKVTARTTTFEATIGEAMNFGSLYVKVQSCQKSSPVDQPESAAFLQIWEGRDGNESEWIYSGWMFASSPGLSSMDHPVYDVWVLDCVEDAAMKKMREEAEKAEEAPPVEGE